MRFAFIDVEKACYPVEVLCDALAVSRSGYYAWRGRPPAKRTRTDAQLAVEIAATHKKSRGRYGSPRIHAELQAHGVRVGRKRVERLMRQGGIAARGKRRFRRTTDSNHEHAIAPNLLERDFFTEQPNQAWVTDVTYIATLEGWAYLAAILDLYSRRVVGWAMSSKNDTALALAALGSALDDRHVLPGLVHHSDRGSPYASDDYRAALTKAGLVASMSRSGDCWDNAVAESFFATLRAELVDDEVYATRSAARASIEAFVEDFYNVTRRHSYLGWVSPIEFELKSRTAELAA